MKRLFNYFKRRREQKLRMWCIQQARISAWNYEAQSVYDWVTSGQPQSNDFAPQKGSNHLDLKAPL